jgi:hypothetical protein
MASSMSFLSLGNVKMILNTWRLHHGGSIPCDLMVSPKEHKDMLHATYRLKIAICDRRKRHLPLTDRCP